MKQSIKEKAAGAFHEVKGSIKEAAGKLCDNPKLEAEGICEKNSGKLQEKVGECEKVLGK